MKIVWTNNIGDKFQQRIQS